MSKDVILGLIRHVLTTLGGSVVASGYLAQDQVTALVGGAVALLGVIWSVLDKKK